MLHAAKIAAVTLALAAATIIAPTGAEASPSCQPCTARTACPSAVTCLQADDGKVLPVDVTVTVPLVYGWPCLGRCPM